MAVRLSATLRQTLAAAFATAVDGGSGGGIVRIYTGSQPANVATTASGTLLLEFILNDPGFTTSGGVATLDADPAITDDAITNGTAGWARVLDSSSAAVMDGSVTGSGGGGDFIISDTSLETGQTVTLISGTVTWPAS